MPVEDSPPVELLPAPALVPVEVSVELPVELPVALPDELALEPVAEAELAPALVPLTVPIDRVTVCRQATFKPTNRRQAMIRQLTIEGLR